MKGRWDSSSINSRNNMPNATIYIKPENWDFWQRVANKSELVNAVIEQGEELAITFPDKLAKNIVLESSSMVEQVPVKDKVVGSSPTSPARGLCKNGHPLDKFGKRCSQKGCKYN